MDLSVVVPVKNEEENIVSLVDEIRHALGASAYEIIYVDDGSTDGTFNVLKEKMATTPELRVIRHKKSCGQSTAVLSGVLSAKAHLVITVDGDGQNDPADIPKMLERFYSEQTAGNKIACIAGWRVSRQDDGLKRISSKIANTVRSKLLGDATPDTGCGIKLFRRDSFLRLPYFDHMHRFLPALFIRSGWAVVSVPVHHRHRERGVSKYGFHNRLWVGIVDILGVLWLLRRAKNPEFVEE